MGGLSKNMKYKISNVYIEVNGYSIPVGVVLGEEDKPYSPFASEKITNSEYEEGLKNFKYGGQRIGDLVYHSVGKISGNIIEFGCDEKWLNELKKMGYNINILERENG